MTVNRIREGVDPSELIPDEHNANLGTERGMAMLHQSLQTTGPGKSVVADKNGRLIAGNKTAEAAAAMGMRFTVVPTYGDELIVHQRLDLDLTEPDGLARQMSVLDNRVSEENLAWDREQLAAYHEAGLDLGAYWHPGELFSLGLNEGAKKAAAAMSKMESPQWSETEESPLLDIPPGTRFRCGNHVLIVGEEGKPGEADVMLNAYERYTGEPAELIEDDDDE